jgi:MAF protein
MGTPFLTLASTSPRRRELLALTGWTFDIRPAAIDESPYPEEAPDRYVARLARLKGAAVAALHPAGRLLLAADTTVADGLELLGKPAGPTDATRMLKQLRSRDHQVYTAIAVLEPGTGKLAADLCRSNVPMRDYSDTEIEAYVASGDPLDKAGAYAIQHAGFHPVERFAGCFASVMGLPLCHLARTMRKLGALPPADVATACQNSLGYDCPVTAGILRGEELG